MKIFFKKCKSHCYQREESVDKSRRLTPNIEHIKSEKLIMLSCIHLDFQFLQIRFNPIQYNLLTSLSLSLSISETNLSISYFVLL
jgi:hypothetical protein